MAGGDDRPLWGRAVTFGELWAFLAVIGAGTYIVGLVGLWLPILRTYDQDFATSWYAVSLVPRTVVAGHGVAQLRFPLLMLGIMTMLFLWGNFLLWAVHRAHVRRVLFAGGFVVVVFFPKHKTA